MLVEHSLKIKNQNKKVIEIGDFKDLAKRTASDKVLRDKTFNITKK